MPPETLKDRLDLVRNRIATACARAHRRESDVKLLAVTKVLGSEYIREAWELGLRDFGENYVQEMERKAPEIADLEGSRFHLIGHLQTNKTKKAAQLFSSIDTIDSAKLATRLNAEARPLEAMIELKLSDEEAKSGASEDEAGAIAATVRSCSCLELRGVMTVPPWSEDPEVSRPYFARLRAIAETLNVPEISMGMSNDLEVAIEEGSTWVRVGTALFGRRQKK